MWWEWVEKHEFGYTKKNSPKREILKSSPQYQKGHQNMLIIPPMLDTDLQPCTVYSVHFTEKL